MITALRNRRSLFAVTYPKPSSLLYSDNNTFSFHQKSLRLESYFVRVLSLPIKFAMIAQLSCLDFQYPSIDKDSIDFLNKWASQMPLHSLQAPPLPVISELHCHGTQM